MLKKRGQVSTFVIIGVLVLFVFIFVFMLRDSIREKFRGTVDREGYLISQMNQIKKTINTCLYFIAKRICAKLKRNTKNF